MAFKDVLNQLAQAYLQKERDRTGVTARRAAEAQAARAAQESQTEQFVKRAQAAEILQRMGLRPREVDSEIALREAQVGATNALATQRETPDTVKSGTPHYETDERGNVTAIVPQPDGSFRQVPVGKVGAPRRETPPSVAVIPTPDGFVRVDRRDPNARATPVLGAEGDPLQPRPSAAERKDQAGLESALEGVGELRKLLAIPGVSDSIGFVSGRVADAKRKTIGAAPEVQALFRTSDRMAEFLLRALSGAQINESEYTRLRDLIPNPRQNITKFTTDLDLFERELQGTLSRRFPGGARPAPTPTPAPNASAGGSFRVIGVR